MLLGMWTLGMLAVLYPLAVGQWRVWRMSGAGWDPEDDYWEIPLREASARLGLHRRVTVLERPGPGMPMTWGVWRPRILLPAEARQWEPDRRCAVLTHELAHVQRFDCLTRMIGRVALALHWFNPWAWIAVRRMRVESERACDDRALVTGAPPADYADLLLGFANRLRSEPWIGAAAISMARRSQLEGRLLAVLDSARDRAGVTRRGLAVAAILAACLLAPVSAIRLSARAQELRADAAGTAMEPSALTEVEIGGARDAAIADGDLVRALAEEMDRVHLREQEGHVYKDKISLDTLWERFRGAHQPDAPTIRNGMEQVEAWHAAAEVDPNRDWRVAHLLAVMARDADAPEEAIAQMRQALELYPHKAYPDPAKHSKFQHLANDLAGLLWDRDGFEAAADWILHTYQADPRFTHFFESWWRNEIERRGEPEERYQVLLAGLEHAGRDRSARFSGEVDYVPESLPPVGRQTPAADEAGMAAEPATRGRLSLRPVGDSPDAGAGAWLTMPSQQGEERLWVLDQVVVDGERIAAVELLQWTPDGFDIALAFDAAGADALADWTGANLGRRLAVVFNGRVLSAPAVRSQIARGRVQIAGKGPVTEIAALVDALDQASRRAGPVDASLSLQELIDAAAAGDVIAIPTGTYTEPLRITKPITLKGVNSAFTMLKVKADRPAIWVTGDIPVRIERMTIEWERATSQTPDGVPLAAVVAVDADLELVDCQFSAESGPTRSPCAVMASGFGDTTISGCVFNGFEFTIQFWGGAQGTVTDCILLKPGHCGITAGNDSTLYVRRNLVAGSAFHGIRCTGGELHVKDNLIVANANRGIYLGNRAAQGSVRNNLILNNATGISSFADSSVAVEHNLIAGSTFAGLDSRDICRLRIHNNLFLDNQRGIAIFEEGGTLRVDFGANQFWDNTVDLQGHPTPELSVLADPALENSADWSPETFAAWSPQDHGLSNPAAIAPLWVKWEAVRKLVAGM